MDLDEHADLILHGGKLTTLDPANPAANALAVTGEDMTSSTRRWSSSESSRTRRVTSRSVKTPIAVSSVATTTAPMSWSIMARRACPTESSGETCTTGVLITPRT